MTWIFSGMTAAEIAAAAAAAGETAAVATPAIAGAGAGAAGAGALGAGGLTAAEGAGLAAPVAAEVAAPAAESSGGLLSSLPGMNMPSANPMGSPMPSMPTMDQLDPAGLFGGSATATPMPAPPPMPAPTMPQPSAPPSTPGVPSSLFSKDNLSSAYQALRMGSKLVNNKRDKQTMGLMTLATGLAANGGDLSSPDAMKMFGDSIGDISAGAEQPKPAAAAPPPAPRLSQFQAPSTSQPPISTDRRLSSFFPPTRLI